ncbi:MAG: cytidine deaminase [Clostridiales bacterium]|jgi:cytidine deaminase|nr:cytidine deaminase [Clostridiales bacterium]
MKRVIHDLEIKNMLRLANDAMDRAYAPYSGYQSGACLKGASGAYYLGCNIENASLTATICAERAAIYKAVTEGERTYDALAIISTGMQPTVPCGLCRQVLSEMCDPGMPVICANRSGKYQVFYVSDLLPQPFSSEDMR